MRLTLTALVGPTGPRYGHSVNGKPVPVSLYQLCEMHADTDGWSLVQRSPGIYLTIGVTTLPDDWTNTAERLTATGVTF